jgi:hypothetical protein
MSVERGDNCTGQERFDVVVTNIFSGWGQISGKVEKQPHNLLTDLSLWRLILSFTDRPGVFEQEQSF